MDTDILKVGQTYTGQELENKGYDINADETAKTDDRLWLAGHNIKPYIFSILDVGNDNYRVLKRKRKW